MRVLVTNDDGVYAPGLSALVVALLEVGHDVIVVAPLGEASGAGAGVGPVHDMGDGIAFEPATIEAAPSVPAYGVNALPALAVLTSCLGGFGPRPDAVVSGINRGLNTGRSVMHSGTVGAALTAQHFKIPALAVSCEWSLDPIWEASALLGAQLIGEMGSLPSGTVLNLNVPSRKLADIRGVRIGSLGSTGLIRTATAEHEQRTVSLDVTSEQPPPGSKTDVGLVEAGYASVTAIVGVRQDENPDLQASLMPVLQDTWLKSKLRV